MFVPVVLTSELREDRAAAYAAGWGNDVLVTVENGDERAYVRALRWDTAEATGPTASGGPIVPGATRLR